MIAAACGGPLGHKRLGRWPAGVGYHGGDTPIRAGVPRSVDRFAMTDSRQFVPELLATLEPLDEGRSTLRAPSPGLWRDPPPLGSLVRGGSSLGELEILGVLHRVRAPAGTLGIVVDLGESEVARRSVEYGEALLTLDPEALGEVAASEAEAESVGAGGELVFRSPSSGRYYQRPAPDRPPFVEVGQVIERGQTVGLLEVMKTFTRINYDDAQLPAKVKVVAILAEDQQDLERGAPILQLGRC
jgi:acetyl-CoA carboxylase biotin carboxyl carrier protein